MRVWPHPAGGNIGQLLIIMATGIWPPGTSSEAPPPPLEGIGTPWACDRERHLHPVLFDTMPDKMTAAILNL